MVLRMLRLFRAGRHSNQAKSETQSTIVVWVYKYYFMSHVISKRGQLISTDMSIKNRTSLERHSLKSTSHIIIFFWGGGGQNHRKCTPSTSTACSLFTFNIDIHSFSAVGLCNWRIGFCLGCTLSLEGEQSLWFLKISFENFLHFSPLWHKLKIDA